MPGDVYHADALSFGGNMQFCWVSRYLTTPFEVAHGAGIFRSATLSPDSLEFDQLKTLTADVMNAFGMQYRGASHTGNLSAAAITVGSIFWKPLRG